MASSDVGHGAPWQQQQRHWSLVGSREAGQGREVRPVSRNLDLWPALVKLQECQETAGINAGSCMPCTHGSAGLGMLSGILITRVRGEVIRGMQWGRWTDMADTQTDSKNQHCHRSDPLSPLKRLSVHLVAISSSPPQNAPHSSRRWCIKPLCPLFPLYV